MICISGYSALMLWRSAGCPELARGRRARVHTSSLRHPSAEELAAVDWRALGLDPIGRRVDLMVCSAEERRQNSRFAYRVHSCELPAGALVRIGGSVYVTSPELTFMQVAEKLDEASLARLAFELCGSYALASGSWEVAECERSQVDGSNRWSAGGNRKGRAAGPLGAGAACRAAENAEPGFNRRPPLTTVARLERFLGQPTLKGARGRAAARRALRHVAEGSRSPMETAMAMLLCLPPRMGGYGFPLPRLNQAVAMRRYLRSIPAKRRYVCDLLWKEYGICVEYDSREHHDRTDGQREQTGIRALNLGIARLTVISVTPRQLYMAGLFDAVARRLAQCMGRRMRIRTEGFACRRQMLRARLLPPSGRERLAGSPEDGPMRRDAAPQAPTDWSELARMSDALAM